MPKEENKEDKLGQQVTSRETVTASQGETEPEEVEQTSGNGAWMIGRTRGNMSEETNTGDDRTRQTGGRTILTATPTEVKLKKKTQEHASEREVSDVNGRQGNSRVGRAEERCESTADSRA